jgi:muramoyltetrapeptide carboxypeptidase
MGAKVTRIGIVGPGRAIDRGIADRVSALAGGSAELVFHPQCFLREGHFAGPDAARAAAFSEFANDPALDAVWFARGG